MTAAQVRESLVNALALDLVGPSPGSPLENEILEQIPTRWYLTGFLIPFEPKQAKEAKRRQEQAEGEEVEVVGRPGVEDDGTPERTSARKSRFPSSMGLSLLVNPASKELEVTATWGDYHFVASQTTGEGEKKSGTGMRHRPQWKRSPRSATIRVDVGKLNSKPKTIDLPQSSGLKIVTSVRSAPAMGREDLSLIPKGTRSVSIFLVNQRPLGAEEREDEAVVFQAALLIKSELPLERRLNPRGVVDVDPDEQVADLQFRDVTEFAVGHGVSGKGHVEPNGECHLVETTWIPRAIVERIEPAEFKGSDLTMEGLATAESPKILWQKVEAMVSGYTTWIESQRALLPKEKKRQEVGGKLLEGAKTAKERIEAGLASLEAPDVFEAFKLANLTMAAAARQRAARERQTTPDKVDPPRWRPFQLAFILLNLRSIVDPASADRAIVDLLFFPTGGGKTEAYLGLSAFTLFLRRLRNPGLASAGVSVFMRYTLRLLTLDQLTRAATLICAMELERAKDKKRLGDWPFEIGLWVGLAATPNHMGSKGDKRDDTARAKTTRFKNNDRNPSPIPLEECPWCATRFGRNSFFLDPDPDYPIDLRIRCIGRSCPFTRDLTLPIVAVDEPIYRRLPCFLIGTVDKFAALPWVGQVGALFGKVTRADRNGFYGPCDPDKGRLLEKPLLPPDLIIQDELHLISGPLGTVAGLYEAAIEALCVRKIDGKLIPPKIVASTATVRRAQAQIRALFGRERVDVFPPPGPNRRDSYFAVTKLASEKNPRLYVGIAAQGRSMKVILLRSYLALLGAAQRSYVEAGGDKAEKNPADPYMTLLGYFNSLRELGGSRRIVEDEISSRLMGFASRRRVGEKEGLFLSRDVDVGRIVELTSRESTSKVAEARRRLGQTFREKERVDVALATNMISVGLDILRLGLMVVLSQPKTTAEYIQATSRVGRDEQRPGLVVTLFNLYRPRDRSHYERFAAYHESFYRAVEATSVTPFSPRAIDRAIAGVTVGLARHLVESLTPARGALAIGANRIPANAVADLLAGRAAVHRLMSEKEAEELRRKVRATVHDLLDAWEGIANDATGGGLQYQREIGQAPPLLREPLDPELPRRSPKERKFRAHRSMRDVEPSVNIWIAGEPDVEESEA